MDYPSDPDVNLYQGKFDDGDANQGRAASRDKAGHYNAITTELLNLIIAGGLVPNEATLDQVAQAAVNIGAANAGRRNYFINGGFDVWQDGNTFDTASGWATDMWRKSNSTGTSLNGSKGFRTPGEALPNKARHYLSLNMVANSNVDHELSLEQRIENVLISDGQYFQLSGHVYTAVARDIAIEITQNFGTNGSPTERAVMVKKISLEIGWNRLNESLIFADITGKTVDNAYNDSYFSAIIWLSAGTNFNANTLSLGKQPDGSMKFSEMQFEKGLLASVFEDRPISTEESLCKRYYEVLKYSIDGT